MILSEKTQAHLQFRTAANERRVASGEYQPSRGLHNTLSLAGDSGEIVWNVITGRDMDALKSMHASGWEGAKTAFLLGGPATMVNILSDISPTQAKESTVQSDADGGIIQTEQSDGQRKHRRSL